MVALSAGLLGGLTYGEIGWVASPVVEVSKTRYSVLGSSPECQGQVIVDDTIRRYLEGFGMRTPDPLSEEASRASRFIGNALTALGVAAVHQNYAVCADVCALVPLAATRVTTLITYAADGANGRYYQVPFARHFNWLFWEPEVDTTMVTADGRLVCVRVRNGADFDRRLFLVVGYEVDH